jgi:hypothetical protein
VRYAESAEDLQTTDHTDVTNAFQKRLNPMAAPRTHPTGRGTHEFLAPTVPVSATIYGRGAGVGRGRGLGGDLGVGVNVAVGVGVNVAVVVGVNVAVGVGVGV